MKNKIILLEGAQGVGKTTITNLLKEKQLYSNLIRLSGNGDKTRKGKEMCENMHLSSLKFMADCEGVNFILDRSAMSEAVYCELGYKPYSFFNELVSYFAELADLNDKYDISFVILKANESDFTERLLRDKPDYSAIKFGVQSSMKQQNKYLEIRDRLLEYNLDCLGLNLIELDTHNKCPLDIVNYIIENS